MQIQEALGEYLLQLEADGRSKHTRDQYKRHVELLSRWLTTSGTEPAVNDIDNRHMARFLASDHVVLRADGQPRKASSANTVRSSMRTFFGFLLEAGLVQQNAARLVRRARTVPGPPRALSAPEQERLLKVLDAAETPASRRDRVLFRMMLATGVRLGEALAIRVKDVALEEAEIRLRFQKGGGEGVLFLSAGTVEMLGEYLGAVDSVWLFPGSDGQSLTSRHAHRRLSQVLEKAKIARDASPHSLRHTFATDLYRRSGDLLLVKEALRHRSINSTLIYARCDAGRLRGTLQGSGDNPAEYRVDGAR